MKFKQVDAAGISVHVRESLHDSDFLSVNGVIVHDEYRVCDLPVPIHTCIDIGGHVGSFSLKLHERQPECAIITVEANPGNISILEMNVSRFAKKIVNAACTYEKGPLVLQSTVFEGSENTGGSTVTPREEVRDHRYRPEPVVATVTLEALLEMHGTQALDLLKLDCEGSEYSILENTILRDKIGVIVGEWHGGFYRFQELVSKHFSSPLWAVDYLSPKHDIGLFRLSRRDWWNMRKEVTHKKTCASCG